MYLDSGDWSGKEDGRGRYFQQWPDCKMLILLSNFYTNQSVMEYFINEYKENYSTCYLIKTQYYSKSKPLLEEASKQSKALQNKLFGKQKENSKEVLGKEDCLSVPPVFLTIDERKALQVCPSSRIKADDFVPPRKNAL